MICDRKAFVECYMPLVEKTVDRFVAKHSEQCKQLRDDMVNEGFIRLCQVSDKFFANDLGEEEYVRNYVRRAARSACMETIRKTKVIRCRSGEVKPMNPLSEIPARRTNYESEAKLFSFSPQFRYRVSDIRVFITCGYAASRVRISHDLAELPESDSLAELIRHKKVIDWQDHIPAEYVADVQELLATYDEVCPERINGKTNPARSRLKYKRRKLTAKLRPILEQALDDT